MLLLCVVLDFLAGHDHAPLIATPVWCAALVTRLQSEFRSTIHNINRTVLKLVNIGAVGKEGSSSSPHCVLCFT